MITLSDGTTTIPLPADLQWTDEYDWSPVEQTKEYSLTGALIVQQGLMARGRPITLQSAGGAWVTRATVRALQSFYGTPNQSMTLSIAGESFAVQFERPGGLRATEVKRLALDAQGDNHWFTIELKFFEVAE